jgi:hypothetical protein
VVHLEKTGASGWHTRRWKISPCMFDHGPGVDDDGEGAGLRRPTLYATSEQPLPFLWTSTRLPYFSVALWRGSGHCLEGAGRPRHVLAPQQLSCFKPIYDCIPCLTARMVYLDSTPLDIYVSWMRVYTGRFGQWFDQLQLFKPFAINYSIRRIYCIATSIAFFSYIRKTVELFFSERLEKHQYSWKHSTEYILKYAICGLTYYKFNMCTMFLIFKIQ